MLTYAWTRWPRDHAPGHVRPTWSSQHRQVIEARGRADISDAVVGEREPCPVVLVGVDLCGPGPAFCIGHDLRRAVACGKVSLRVAVAHGEPWGVVAPRNARVSGKPVLAPACVDRPLRPHLAVAHGHAHDSPSLNEGRHRSLGLPDCDALLVGSQEKDHVQA